MTSHVRIIAGLIVAVAMLMSVGHGGANAEEYLLKPGDVVEITVLEDPNLNRRMLIGPDGNIALPLAGTIEAGGRSLKAIQGAIRDRLRNQFVSPPSVTASLVSLGAGAALGPDGELVELSTVYIMGEVQRPGRYEYNPDEQLNVLKALALAGGPSEFAARKRIQVRETGENGETVRLFDYDAIEDGAAIDEATAQLSNGAIIVVPERGLFE